MTVREPLFWAIIAALIAYELIAILTGPNSDTITEIIQRRTTQHPIIPLIIGLILGHLFWR